MSTQTDRNKDSYTKEKKYSREPKIPIMAMCEVKGLYLQPVHPTILFSGKVSQGLSKKQSDRWTAPKCWFLFLKCTISQQRENRNTEPRTKQPLRASYNTWAVPSQIQGFGSVVSVLSTSHELINIDGSSCLTTRIFLQYLTEGRDVAENI